MKPRAHRLERGSLEFLVWAPLRNRVDLKIVSPNELLIPMQKTERGYWRVEASDVLPGAHYRYRLDNKTERPDPASRFQPQGVHGPSQVIDHSSFSWEDGLWKGMALEQYVIYELHAGTFTKQGTFDAIIQHLDYLRDLGITAIELMPIAQFPGTRNWGYDGVYPYAVQNSYGGPDGLKRLVNACHGKRIAVVLDVVYNHLGPEGNYLWDFGPYFTDKYKTPWGEAINFDGPYSDEVRHYFIQSALDWITDYHIDALRVDAIHGIFDFSARHFLQELGEAVHTRAEEFGRKILVIPESDLNDARIINPVEQGGYGLDAQWNDDFHHCLHTLLTEEKSGYYEDFGTIEQMARAYSDGFVYSGQYSLFRKRRHGNSSKNRPACQFVVFSQNHDQVGNRMQGDRLTSQVSFEQQKLAAGAVLLSPFIPLLFMGEEYGEPAPFQYFVSHGDDNLIKAVRNGRKEEFRAFGWKDEPPDPQSEETFLKSKIDLELRHHNHHHALFNFYTELLRVRKTITALRTLSKTTMEVRTIETKNLLVVRRWSKDLKSEAILLINFNANDAVFPAPFPGGQWEKALDSADTLWNGPGSLLPGKLKSNDAIVLHGHSIGVYVSAEKQ
jgi:maltooligosyltrehalose trehalohydrolase